MPLESSGSVGTSWIAVFAVVQEFHRKPPDGKLLVIELGIGQHCQLTSTVPALIRLFFADQQPCQRLTESELLFLRCSFHWWRDVFVGIKYCLAFKNNSLPPYLHTWPSSGPPRSSAYGIFTVKEFFFDAFTARNGSNNDTFRQLLKHQKTTLVLHLHMGVDASSRCFYAAWVKTVDQWPLLKMALPISEIRPHWSHFWSILADTGQRTRRPTNNTTDFFFPGRQLLPLNQRHPVEKLPPCDSDVEPVTGSSHKRVDLITLNRSLASETVSNTISYRKDQVFFPDPCWAFQRLNLCSLFDSHLPANYISVIAYAATWHSQDPDEDQSDGDDFHNRQEQIRPPDQQTAGTGRQSGSGLRGSIECTGGSSYNGGGERAECSSSQRSVSAEAEPPPSRAPAEDHVGWGSGCGSYDDNLVGPMDRRLHDRLPTESRHQSERSSNVAQNSSSCCSGSTSPQQLQRSERCRHRGGSEELLAASGAIVHNRRAATSFTHCGDRPTPGEPRLGGRLDVECSDAVVEPFYVLCESADDGGNEESPRFFDAAAGEHSRCALCRSDVFRRSGGRAPGCSCDYFDDDWLVNPIGQPYLIEVVDDDLTQCPGDRQHALPEGFIRQFSDYEELHESTRHPAEVVDVDYDDDAGDEVTARLCDGSVCVACCENLNDGVIVRGRGEHGRCHADDSASSFQAVDDAPAAEDGLTRSRRPSTL